jgi:histidyl-tRNA synthetase
LQEYLRSNEDRLSSEVRDRIDLNPLRAFDSAHEGTLAVMRAAPRLLDELDRDDAEHFAQVRELLDRAELSYEVDPTLVRGLDYYSRTVFEFTSDALGAQSGVGGGGRYDGLVAELGGPPTPGMGWAAGIERILLAGSQPVAGAAVVDLYVGLDFEGEDRMLSSIRRLAFGVLSDARAAGLAAQMEMAGRSLKGQLSHANRVGARYVALVGERGTLLKDMQDGTQERLDSDRVVHAVLRGLRELA